MDTVGLIIACLGLLAHVAGAIWLLVCAFKRSVVWGLLFMFVPFASLVYVIVDWNRASKPFLLTIASFVVIFVGAGISTSMRKTFTTDDHGNMREMGSTSTTTTSAPAKSKRATARPSKTAKHLNNAYFFKRIFSVAPGLRWVTERKMALSSKLNQICVSGVV